MAPDMTDVQRFVIAILTLMMFGAIGGYLVWKGTSEGIVNIILGALITMAVGAVQYYLGSSKGSTDKDKTINDLSKGPGP